MKKLLAIIVFAAALAASPLAKAETASELFANTNWNSLTADIYDNYIFYKTHMERPNIYFFEEAMRECMQNLRSSLQTGEAGWPDAPLVRFKNLIAIALVGLYEMNKYAATENFTEPAAAIASNLREAYAAMREKHIYSASTDDFMRGFRKLEESGIAAQTCAEVLVSKKWHAANSTLQIEYTEYNDNIQHVLFSAKNGEQNCAWTGNCLRMEARRIRCAGALGSQGSFEGVEQDGRLIIQEQSIDKQCGFAAMSGIYENRAN